MVTCRKRRERNLPENSALQKININKFQKDLVSWYEAEKRDLPWRHERDPYKIWVSEIMLQQTRVDTVIPYFNRFMEQFPTVESLAGADEEAVMKAWEGLGYYSRVRNLQSAVKEVAESYGGVVPADKDEFLSLKGVGPYTGGAVLSIAYGLPEPAVDGNVMRVMSRILTIWDDIAKPSARKIFEQAVRKIMYEEDPSSFNQALMELGATICTPTSPACLLCPVQNHCQAFEEGIQRELPVKTKKKSDKKIRMGAVVLEAPDGTVLIEKRPSSGLLANLWQFPNMELPTGINPRSALEAYVEAEYGLNACIQPEKATDIIHIFSHLTWEIDVYIGTIDAKTEKERTKFVSKEDLETYAFSVSHQKIWQHVKGMDK
ncbi:A/G-specific adenine glycosylase [Domibacillus iocasae]|uniref:Adenine DNA glycosylase n=1 Tax=Domibacillus iocasae TaxID=1714016 RepID=A0A1E7DPU8_9BACI|nr:A/G-specific adenine glycosylase [Domibacillus iocasae]OES45069.1 A/G-specific adenine glycosylase [Domibacillus iocasae]